MNLHRPANTIYTFQVLREKTRPKICKIIWAVLVFGLMLLTFYMIYKLLHDYFQYDSYNKISTKFETSLVFPAISICNLNYINYTKLTDYLQDDPDTRNSLDAFLFGLTANGHDPRDPFKFINQTAFNHLEEWEENLNESVSITFRNELYDMMIGKNRPNLQIRVPDWLITNHVT